LLKVVSRHFELGFARACIFEALCAAFGGTI
jgi:hypothetical protein